ncbi:MAG TPA: kelch repeat-containing protein [Candidatus Acidoferrales bacterium]|nr:kelch repeat-containing protein [Candidatus Acidoferrales bacterium]
MAVPLKLFAGVSVAVSPASVNLSPNGAQQFTATVTGASNTSVTWSIQQGATGGTILGSGLYTAPGAVGNYVVIVTSNADNTQSAFATVSVAGFIHAGLLNPDPVTATLLASGMVLYTDGGPSGFVTSPAEIYNPATSTSNATGSMTILRWLETATLLGNGKVLFAGGQTSSGTTATAELYDPVTGMFAATGSMTVPRQGHTATLLPDGKVLIVGGVVGNCNSSCSYNTAEIYDPAAGTFSLTAGNLPSPPGSVASILLLTGKVLVAGGGSGGSAELYDPGTGFFTATGTLVNQNDAFSATLLQSGKVLFVTGGNNGVAASTAEIYDPSSGTFTATGNLQLARGFDTATLLKSGQVLIVGGLSSAPAELFDPATGTFSLTGSVQEMRISQQATALPDGTVLIAGGSSVFQGLSSIEVYDPSAKSFSGQSVFMKAARSGHAAAQLADGRLLLTGGEDAFLNVISSAEIYDPVSGGFTLTGPLIQGRHGHTATLLGNGNVLIVGGYEDSAGAQNGNTLVATAEIYNPASGTFSLISGPNLARAYHTATLLPNGKVLIAGGVTAAQLQSPTSSVEIYDPVMQAFTQAGNMFAVRYNHAATLMNDGRVLISDGLTIAGTPGNGIGLDEIYDPSSGQFAQAGPKEVINNHSAAPTASILLQNGQVLADNQSIFDPVSNSLTTLSSLVTLQTLLQDYEFALLPGGQVLTTSNGYATYLFDPTSQTYSQSGSMQYFRSRPTLYTLPNHEVMVAGGVGIAQVEIYVPPTASANAAPALSAINPSTVVAGGAGFTMLVEGSNFVSNSVINFNGAARQTTFLSTTQLSTALLPSDIANTGTATITVSNPASGSATGITSNPLTLSILAANIQPVIGALSPASTTAGGAAFILLLSGSGFTQNSAVTFNGNHVPAAFISVTQLQANIPAGAIVTAGSFLVAVGNPGGNPTTVVSFTVNNPVPQENLLSPASATAGSAGVTLDVNGSNFNLSSKVLINGAVHTTTYVSSTLLQTGLSASDLLKGATLNISVSNPTPGGGTTSMLPFAVTDYSVAVPVPTVTVSAGQTAVFNLTVAPSNGTFANSILFTATGLPSGAVASFSPSATVTPGATSQTVILSITTIAHAFSTTAYFPRLARPTVMCLSVIGIAFALVGLVFISSKTAALQWKRFAPRLITAILLIGVASTMACSTGGGASAPQANPASGTPAGSYTITITGATGGIVHSASATITVI